MRKKCYNLLILVVSFSIIMSMSNITSFNSTDGLSSKEELNTALWDLTGTPIYIDDTDINNDWAKTETSFPWCTGSGTWIDPYVIQDVFIDGQGTDTCITIVNSDQYFEIRNCTVINSGEWSYPDYHAGISLSNVRNGLIINNSLISNQGRSIAVSSNSYDNIFKENVIKHNYGGIFLENSPDNVIEQNWIQNMTWSNGILAYQSDNTLIKENYIREVGTINLAPYSIDVSDSYYCTIRDNLIEKSPAGGISIAAGAYNDVYNNTSREHGGDIWVSGFKIVNSFGNEVWNNSFSKNDGYGVSISNAYGNAIHSNQIIENELRGVSIVTGNHNEIYLNNVSKNEKYGVYINHGFNNTIHQNFISQNDDPGSNDGDGVHLISCEATYIRNNTISKNDEHGIYFEESTSIEIENNNLYENARAIYGLWSNASLIQFNEIIDNGYGVWLSYCRDSVIKYNNASLQFVDGIRLSDCVYNEILHNIANENGVGAIPSRGIGLYTSSDYNYIFNNTCLSTRGYGIGISQSDFNEIRSNNLSKNLQHGIDIYSSKGNVFTDNYAGENENGVRIWSTDIGFATINNNFTGNCFVNNDNGIYFYQYANDSFVSNNSFINNSVQGVYLTEHNQGNIFTENQFQGNALHARDDAVNTFWSHYGRGNYWDNYTGTDLNDDGIGDDPYTFINGLANSEDPYPLYEDGDDLPPIINVLLPLGTEFFSTESPDFELEIVERYVNRTWYTINGGVSKYFFSGTEGKINQSLWNSMVDGSITLTFYVNDSIGNQDNDSVIITKDTTVPYIEINEPSSNQEFGITSPSFSLTITEINLNVSWYTINGGFTKYYFTSNSSINQAAWDSIPEGDVIITFYVEDKAGNISSESITIKKQLSSSPPAIPGYDLLVFAGLMMSCIIALGFHLKRKY